MPAINRISIPQSNSGTNENVAYLSWLSLKLQSMHGTLPEDVKQQLLDNPILAPDFHINNNDIGVLKSYMDSSLEHFNSISNPDQSDKNFVSICNVIRLKLGNMNNSLTRRERRMIDKYVTEQNWNPELQTLEIKLLMDITDFQLEDARKSL